MKLVATALAGALVAGVGVFFWRDAEIDDRQARLSRATRQITYSELVADNLKEEIKSINRRLRRARTRLQEEIARSPQTIVAPAPSTEPDGRYFGYIESIQGDTPGVIVVDFASFLSGRAAERAAVAEGAIAPGEGVPNDYFITNVSSRLRTLELDSEIVTIIETGGPTGGPLRRRIPFTRFLRLFNRAEGEFSGVSWNGYWITIREGRVTKLREQWVP